MTVKTFRIEGNFQMGEQVQPFVKECRAENEKQAVEWVNSELGSKHRTPRNKIWIEKIEEIKS
ncbi:MAG: 50S ribosomal protein L18a [Euryarchaeota archaeon]|nr:50S ribosomal protein L18a [Euryarchaeota archaeon]